MSRTDRPLACVMGDMDLVRPLGLAGVPCVAVAAAGAPPRFSRFSTAVLDCADAWDDPGRLLDTLVQFGASQATRPILFYEEDGYLLLISRHRERLGGLFRFVLPDSTLVEDLVDKARFQALADRLALPVPKARATRPWEDPWPADLKAFLPLIVKPLTRRPTQWEPLAGDGKAVRVNTVARLRELWKRAATARLPLLVQQLIDGDETAIESYHVYIDDSGEIRGEFTGKKIRTYPLRYGDSTALVTTDADDVRTIGRDILRRLNFRGVAKCDFKRDAAGRLHLFEINPRFTLWNHLGAIAGVNIPEMVYRDLTGLPRGPVRRARAGVQWCRIWKDVKAARAEGMPLVRWLAWALRCDVKSTIALDDPLPLVGAVLWRGFSQLASIPHRLQPHDRS